MIPSGWGVCAKDFEAEIKIVIAKIKTNDSLSLEIPRIN